MITDAAKTILVGTGGYASTYYLQHILNHEFPEVELIAVVDPFVKKSPHYGALLERDIPRFNTLEDCFAQEGNVELVIICSPIHYHAEHIRQAAGHCRIILCEKPMTSDLDAAQVILRIHKEQTPVAIGFQWSFSKSILRLKRDLHAGRFGKVLHMKALLLSPRDVAYYSRNNWAGRIYTDAEELVLDSPLSNATAHFLHNFFFLLGETPETAARPLRIQGVALGCNDIENFDTALLKLAMPNDTEILFYCSHAGTAYHEPRFQINCAEACIVYDPDSRIITATFNSGEEILYGNPDADETKKIRDCARFASHNTPVPCTAESALPHVLAVNAFQECIGEVRDFPEAFVESNDERVFVPELDAWLTACYEKGCMLSDLGLEWGVPCPEIEVQA